MTSHYALMVEHFGDGVLLGRPLLYGAEDALGNARTIDAAFESLKSGRQTSLK